MKLCFLDFEFHDNANKDYILVSVSIICTDNQVVVYERDYWLLSNTQRNDCKRFIKRVMDEGYTFCSYAFEAEARSLMTLFNDKNCLRHVKVIDLYLEYRCLLNHNHELGYGEQYIQGRVITTSPPPPKWERKEGDEEDEAHHKPSYSLAGALFKFLRLKIDTKEKNEVREILIAGKIEEIQSNMDRIIAYNKSDTRHLQALFLKVQDYFYKKNIPNHEWIDHAYMRGDYAMRTAMMTRLGYPVNVEKIKKFMSNTQQILNRAIEDCNEAFATEMAIDDRRPFRFNRKTNRYIANEKTIREWAEKQEKPYWRKTAKQKTSISKDAFKDWYSSETPGFAGAFCRYLKTKQSLNGFMPGGKKGKFSDYLGKDDRARAYFGIYGSQSSRSQPGSIGFIPLKAHWMRNFIEAPKGRAICGIDYASQEFLIAAILSQDMNMIEAYATGDVYLAFARSAGLVPQDATKESHKKEREMCKTLVLGISYDMSYKGLSHRMGVSEEKAEDLIDTFFEVYEDYKQWKYDVREEYEDYDLLSLSDGWMMWGDNDNHRSVGNFPVQGHGAVIMREAVRLAQDAGLDIIYTLHDAIYMEYDALDLRAIDTLKQCMSLAFENVMSKFGYTIPIRLEGDAWSKDYVEEEKENIKFMKEYVDNKGLYDIHRFSEFFM